jgi:hypothetical protein
MACLLTQGYDFAGCKGGGGGISEVLITEFSNVSSIALTSNVVTTITMVSTKVFRRYILDKNMGTWSDNATFTPESGTWSYAPTVSFSIKGLSTSLQSEIKLLGQNVVIMIVKDRNGVYRMFGQNLTSSVLSGKGMDLLTVESTAGKALTDFNGFNLTFAGQELDYAHEVNSAIIAGIL